MIMNSNINLDNVGHSGLLLLSHSYDDFTCRGPLASSFKLHLSDILGFYDKVS